MNETKYLNSGDLVELTQVFRRYEDSDLRNILMLELLVLTGPRPSELLGVRVSDVCLSDGLIFYKGLKGSRDRNIPLPSLLVDRLRVYISGIEDPAGLLFPISYNRLRDIWFEYRPVKKKLHSLRHTFAIELYRKSKDVRLIQRALGHRYLSTTLIYTDYLYSLDEMRQFLG